MKDIARDLQVSVVTVSKVFRNHGGISPATRKRVLQRMKELNYQPNWAARSLATKRTYTIGLVIPDLMHSFFAEVAKGVTRKVRPHGYHVVISNSEEDPEIENQEVELLLARQVDGLILASAQPPGRSEIFRRIRQRRVPFVLIDRRVRGLKANYVGVNDEETGRVATEHLIDRGCQRIAHIRGPAVSTGEGRLGGYQAALESRRLQMPAGYVVKGGYGVTTGYEAMRRLLAIEPRPDGVFCFNDPVAAGAVKAILEAGLRVPEDIAVVGAGNVHYSDLLRVPLSTIDQGSSALGESAAELLLQVIESKRVHPSRSVFLPPRLIVRESSDGTGR